MNEKLKLNEELKQIFEIIIEIKTEQNVFTKDFLSYNPPDDWDNDIKEMYKSFCRVIADIYSDDSIQAFVMTTRFNLVSKNLMNFIENNKKLSINEKIDFLTLFDDIILSIRKLSVEDVDEKMNEFKKFRFSLANNEKRKGD